MNRISKEFTKSIWNVDYTFKLEFGYYPAKGGIDPRDHVDAELIDHEFIGPIHAWNNATEIGYEVDPSELDIDIQELFMEAIS